MEVDCDGMQGCTVRATSRAAFDPHSNGLRLTPHSTSSARSKELHEVYAALTALQSRDERLVLP
jgi:hypothetical protein